MDHWELLTFLHFRLNSSSFMGIHIIMLLLFPPKTLQLSKNLYFLFLGTQLEPPSIKSICIVTTQLIVTLEAAQNLIYIQITLLGFGALLIILSTAI